MKLFFLLVFIFSTTLPLRSMQGTSLIKALTKENREVEEIRELIEQGANVNATSTDYNLCTPLMIASLNGYRDICSLLILQNANVRAKDNEGYQALHYAAFGGDIEICRLIILKDEEMRSSGAKKNWREILVAGQTLTKDTLLNASVESKFPPGLSPLNFLLSFTTLIGATKKVEPITRTPLILALSGQARNFIKSRLDSSLQDVDIIAKEHQIALFRFLLEKGAQWIPHESNTWTPLTEAARNDCHELFTELIDRYKNSQDNLKELLLSNLDDTIHGQRVLDDSIVNQSISSGPHQGSTPLMWAARSGHIITCKILILNGANIHTTITTDGKYKGTTPLHWAATNDQAAVCSLLIEKGANINAISEKGYTPLILAAQNGCAEVVTCLIQHNSDPNTFDETGLTALMWAATQGHENVCSRLIDAGVNPHGKGGKRFRELTPLILAAREGKGHKDVINTLIIRTCMVPSASHMNTYSIPKAIKSCSGQILKIFKYILGYNLFSEEELTEQNPHEIIKTYLVCFKRLAPSMPSDIRTKLFCLITDLQEPLGKIMLARVLEQRAFPREFLPITIDALKKQTIEYLKPLMVQAQKKAKDNKIKALLDHESIELNYGTGLTLEITKYLENHLKSTFQHKAYAMKNN